ncbi:MAG: LCP family protein [Thermoleophilia bacterium]
MTRSVNLNQKPYTVYAVRRSAPRRWARVALVTLLFLMSFVLVAAGGVYVWLDLQVRKANNGPGDSAAVSVIREPGDTSLVDPALDKPDAQDILILGSDSREGEGEVYGRSDTLMIVHVDPAEDFVSVLSLPRDLRVEVPEHGMQKINAAFAFGGPALSIETVQWVTRLDIDHYINVDFEAFRSITTALGGIYVDVDRRYYYGGIAYEKIDVQPGYQRLAGEQALDYVRFRHDNNLDFGRIERQQRFLQAAREQVSKWDAALKIPQLVQLLARNTSTDMTTAEGLNQVLKLALWGVRLDGSRIKQVTLEAETREMGGASYVIATDEAIRRAVDDLITAPSKSPSDDAGTTSTSEGTGTSGGSSSTVTTPERVDLTGVTVNVFNGNGRSGEAAGTGAWLQSMGAVIGRIGDAKSHDNARSSVLYPPTKSAEAQRVADALGLTRVREDASGADIAVILGADFTLPAEFRPAPTVDNIPDSVQWKEDAARASFTLMAPAVIPEGFGERDSRLYEIQTDDGSFPALKVMFRLGREDQYLGVMETTFLDAPAAAPDEEVTQDGTVFTVVASDGRVERVWWKKDGVLYWVSNTLGYHLDRDALLAVAGSMIPLP